MDKLLSNDPAESGAIASLLQQIRDFVRKHMEPLIENSDTLRRDFIMADYVLSLLIGTVEDDIINKVLNSIDNGEFFRLVIAPWRGHDHGFLAPGAEHGQSVLPISGRGYDAHRPDGGGVLSALVLAQFCLSGCVCLVVRSRNGREQLLPRCMKC